VKIPIHKWYCLTIAHHDGLVPRQHANRDLQAAVGVVMNDQNAEGIYPLSSSERTTVPPGHQRSFTRSG
jgi:hypothetical protein